LTTRGSVLKLINFGHLRICFVDSGIEAKVFVVHKGLIGYQGRSQRLVVPENSLWMNCLGS
jgi:hypothetical protein